MAQHFRTLKFSGYFASVFFYFFSDGCASSTTIRQFLEYIWTSEFSNLPSSVRATKYSAWKYQNLSFFPLSCGRKGANSFGIPKSRSGISEFTFAGVAVVIMGTFCFDDSFVSRLRDILVYNVFCNANGCSLYTCLFLVLLSGRHELHFRPGLFL